MDYRTEFRSIQDEAFNLFLKKNADYGNAFEEFGIIGILIRINDKIKRSINISKKDITLVEDENLRDTLIDLHNYCALAICLINKD